MRLFCNQGKSSQLNKIYLSLVYLVSKRQTILSSFMKQRIESSRQRRKDLCLALLQVNKGVTHESSGVMRESGQQIIWRRVFTVSHFLEHIMMGRLQKTKVWENFLTAPIFWSIELK